MTDKTATLTSKNLLNRLRARLITVPKPGTQPWETDYPFTLTSQTGGEHKAGDDAGVLQVASIMWAGGANKPRLQEHVYAVEPLCEEAATEIERLQGTGWFFEYQALVAACAQAGFQATKEPDSNYGGERTVLVPMRTAVETTAEAWGGFETACHHEWTIQVEKKDWAIYCCEKCGKFTRRKKDADK